MKFGIIVFPGSNCDRDMMHALQDDLKQEVVMLWHKDQDLSMFTKKTVSYCRAVSLTAITCVAVRWRVLAL